MSSSSRLWRWRLAGRNLQRNWQRNTILGLVLACSFAGLLVFLGYSLWVEHYLRNDTVYINQMGHLLISRPDGLRRQLGRPQQALLSVAEQDLILAALAADPDVAMVGRGLQSMLLAVHGCQNRGILAIGRDPAVERQVLSMAELRLNAELLHPELLEAWQQLRDRTPLGYGVYPTPRLAQYLGTTGTGGGASCPGQAAVPADLVQLMGKTVDGYTTAADARYLGTQSTGLALLDERTLFIQTPDLQRLLETPRLGYLSIYAKSIWALPRLYQRLQPLVAAQQLNLQPFFAEEVGLYYRGTVAFLTAISVFFVGLTAAMVGLTMVSLLTMTAAERSTEFGLLTALGYRAEAIVQLFVMEGLLLSVLGLSGGLVLAYSAKALLAAAQLRVSPPGIAGDTNLEVIFEPWLIGLVGLPLLFGTVAATYIVARRKLRSGPVALLIGSPTM